ncbi:LysM domain-containing protein [Candidatus Villigracilis affinis]|uniref:LysM domain-containing protein n=1 Tax=Candidatus Villigracilis affinis TaxID=3140682 RepID=UPI001D369CF4|nr:LysM peptidoglycan-binding domain-containing protein [Anaerolineales bacterium]
MTKLIRSFISSVTAILLLASCSLTGGAADAAVAQATPALPAVVTIELGMLADTSVPFNTVGQVIKYTFSVKNSGTASTPGPIIVTGATCPEILTVGNLDASLDPGETVVCTSSYTITQADLDRGSVTTTAMATVNNVNSNQATTTVATVPPVILKLTKTANPTTYDRAGQTITYTYVITNVGAATLGPAQFTVTDTGIPTPINCGEATATLASNATVTCSATYTTTQADMGAASLSTNATAAGGGAPTSPPVGATVTKSATTVTPSASSSSHTVIEGEWIWQIARCYGVDPNKLAADNKDKIPDPSKIKPGVVLTVNNPGGYSKFYGPPCITFVSHTLQAGDTWATLGQKYSADPTVLQLANATTSLTSTGSVIKLRIPNYSAGTVTIPPTQTKALTLTITANPLTYDQAAQVITFTYIIKNSGTGNLGPAQFTVSGGLLGATPLNCGDAAASIAPGATITCTSAYTITQGDLTLNSISHQATASGGGAGPSQAASVTINKVTKLLTLTIAANPLTYTQAGQIITFTYAIKNSGSVNLGPSQFTITGGLHGATPINCGDATATILPGATLTCSASYTITDADLAVPTLSHMVIASGGGAAPSQPASITIAKQ